MERPVREPDQRAQAAGDGDPDCAAGDLCAAVSDVWFGEGGCACSAGGAVCAYWRSLPGEAAWVEFFCCGMGWIYCAVRDGGADRRGDGDLSGGGGGAARRCGWPAYDCG